MSWQKVYNVLYRFGGKIDLAEPAEIAAATSDGPGEPLVQIQIAQIEYARYERNRKETNNGQTNWNYG